MNFQSVIQRDFFCFVGVVQHMMHAYCVAKLYFAGAVQVKNGDGVIIVMLTQNF
jgi:hypothetical protein